MAVTFFQVKFYILFSEYRDKCTLFVKGLPKNTTEADLKKLSKDIVDARIKLRKVTKSKRPILICQG